MCWLPVKILKMGWEGGELLSHIATRPTMQYIQIAKASALWNNFSRWDNKSVPISGIFALSANIYLDDSPTCGLFSSPADTENPSSHHHISPVHRQRFLSMTKLYVGSSEPNQTPSLGISLKSPVLARTLKWFSQNSPAQYLIT